MGFINAKRPQEVRSGENLRHVKDVVQDLLLNSTIQQVERLAGFGPINNPAVGHHTKVELDRSPVSFLFDFLNDRERQGYLVGIEGLNRSDAAESESMIRHFVKDTAHLSRNLDSIPDLYEAMVKTLLQVQKDEHKNDDSDYVFDIVERLELAQTLPNGKRVVQVVTVHRPGILAADGDTRIEDQSDRTDQESEGGDQPFDQNQSDDAQTTGTSPTEGDAAATAPMEDTSTGDTTGDAEEPKDHPEEGNETMSIKDTAEKIKNGLKEGVEDLKSDNTDNGRDDSARNDINQDTTTTYHQDADDTVTGERPAGDRLEDDLSTDEPNLARENDITSTRVYDTGGAPLSDDDSVAVVDPGDTLSDDPLRDDGVGVVDATPGSMDAPVPDPLYASEGIEDPDRDLVRAADDDLDGPFPGDLPSDRIDEDRRDDGFRNDSSVLGSDEDGFRSEDDDTPVVATTVTETTTVIDGSGGGGTGFEDSVDADRIDDESPVHVQRSTGL